MFESICVILWPSPQSIFSWGASIYDVRSGGRGVPKKQTKGTKQLSSVHDKGDGIKKSENFESENFADVIYGSPHAKVSRLFSRTFKC